MDWNAFEKTTTAYGESSMCVVCGKDTESCIKFYIAREVGKDNRVFTLDEDSDECWSDGCHFASFGICQECANRIIDIEIAWGNR